MKNLRYKLIKLLAAGELILMNWNVNGLLVKEGHSVVYIPKKR